MLLNLTKIGNLKLGMVRNGMPMQTNKILVTQPTKNGEENFQIFPGFKENGEDKVEITLPFDSIENNFEVNYVGFVSINEIEYIVKSENLGMDTLMFPLNFEDQDEAVIDAGKLTPELIENYKMERTGLLRTQLKGISGYGEVFYLKTKSVNSINNIQTQLKILSTLTKGNLMGLPLVLKPIKKEHNEKSILYVSISYEGTNVELSEYIRERNSSLVDVEAFENLYNEIRTPKETTSIEDFSEDEIKVESKFETDIQEIVGSATVKIEVNSVVEKYIKENETKIPERTLNLLFNNLKNEEKFLEFMETNPSVKDCLVRINKKD